MSTLELRNQIHQYVDQADDVFLKMVYAMSKAYKNNIAGYSVEGSPITTEDLKKRVLAASKRVKSGDFITQESIENEIE